MLARELQRSSIGKLVLAWAPWRSCWAGRRGGAAGRGAVAELLARAAGGKANRQWPFDRASTKCQFDKASTGCHFGRVGPVVILADAFVKRS